jgi:phosphoserine phosphatase
VTTAFCFDLDGTLTRQEILPAIASEIGLFEELTLLTSLTMRGLIPFESSFRLRCRILQDIPLSRVREIVASIPLEPTVETFIRENRERCAVVTGNLDVWVRDLVAQLGCRAFSSVATSTGDRLTGLAQIIRKNESVDALRSEGFKRVVAIGDGFNDIPMFRAADLSVAFGGVHPPVPELVDEANYLVFRGASLCRLLSML